MQSRIHFARDLRDKMFACLSTIPVNKTQEIVLQTFTKSLFAE